MLSKLFGSNSGSTGHEYFQYTTRTAKQSSKVTNLNRLNDRISKRCDAPTQSFVGRFHNFFVTRSLSPSLQLTVQYGKLTATQTCQRPEYRRTAHYLQFGDPHRSPSHQALGRRLQPSRLLSAARPLVSQPDGAGRITDRPSRIWTTQSRSGVSYVSVRVVRDHHINDGCDRRRHAEYAVRKALSCRFSRAVIGKTKNARARLDGGVVITTGSADQRTRRANSKTK